MCICLSSCLQPFFFSSLLPSSSPSCSFVCHLIVSPSSLPTPSSFHSPPPTYVFSSQFVPVTLSPQLFPLLNNNPIHFILTLITSYTCFSFPSFPPGGFVFKNSFSLVFSSLVFLFLPLPPISFFVRLYFSQFLYLHLTRFPSTSAAFLSSLISSSPPSLLLSLSLLSLSQPPILPLPPALYSPLRPSRFIFHTLPKTFILPLTNFSFTFAVKLLLSPISAVS